MTDLRTMTEEELRDYKVPWPDSLDELNDIIIALADREQTYGTCVYAMSIASTATFNYIASKVGATGFQASCADMDILKRTRHMERFMIVNLGDAIYPHHDFHGQIDRAMEQMKPWLAETAKKRLEDEEGASENVINHWKRLAENG